MFLFLGPLRKRKSRKLSSKNGSFNYALEDQDGTYQITHLERKMMFQKPPRLCSMWIFKGVINLPHSKHCLLGFQGRAVDIHHWQALKKKVATRFFPGCQKTDVSHRRRSTTVPWLFYSVFPSWGKMALRQWGGCQFSIANDQHQQRQLHCRSWDAW